MQIYAVHILSPQKDCLHTYGHIEQNNVIPIT